MFFPKRRCSKFTFLDFDEKFKSISDIDALKIFEAKKDEKYLPFEKNLIVFMKN